MSKTDIELTDAIIEYRDISGFPGYRIGSDGNVWSLWIKGKRGTGNGRGQTAMIGTEWRCLKSRPDPYLGVTLIRRPQHSKVSARIHIIVLTAFRGPCPDGMEGCHRDGNKANNALLNLYWGTRAQNTADKIRHGTLIKGEQHPFAVLRASDIDSIRERRRNGEVLRTIAADFNISLGHVHNIAAGKCWRASYEQQ